MQPSLRPLPLSMRRRVERIACADSPLHSVHADAIANGNVADGVLVLIQLEVAAHDSMHVSGTSQLARRRSTFHPNSPLAVHRRVWHLLGRVLHRGRRVFMFEAGAAGELPVADRVGRFAERRIVPDAHHSLHQRRVGSRPGAPGGSPISIVCSRSCAGFQPLLISAARYCIAIRAW